MLVPGGNILQAALQVINKQTFTYRAFLGRTLNSIGLDEPTYYDPVVIRGSAQPPPREKFEQMGLDLQRSYMVFYISKNLLDLSRDVAGDLIEFDNKTWQVESKTPWFAIDGWIQLIAVQIVRAEC